MAYLIKSNLNDGPSVSKINEKNILGQGFHTDIFHCKTVATPCLSVSNSN